MNGMPAARYRPLGAFRFGLALLVVLQHFQHLLPPDDRGVFSHLGLGAIAVACFFAVSGFVVAEANATFYRGRPAEFLLNRAVRLAPPYFAALALSIVVHAVLWYDGRLVLWDYSLTDTPLRPRHLLAGLFGLVPGFNPRLLGDDFEFIPFVWTLRLEVAFYLAAAATMALCWHLRAAWPAGAAIAAGLIASAAFLLLAGRPGILSTVPMFLFGSCLFLLELRVALRRLALLAICILVAAAGFVSWRQHGAPVLAWQLPLLAVLLGLFAWLAVCAQLAVPREIDRRLGELSYPLYLNHYVVGIAAESAGMAPGVGGYAGAVVAAVLLSVGASQVIDRRLVPLRNRIRKRQC